MFKSYFLLIIFISACSSKPHAINFDHNKITLNNKITTIFIVSHGLHTGIIIPANEIQQNLPTLKQRFNSTQYFEFGWGDRGFYQAKNITIGLTIAALFWPTDSVIHVVAIPADVTQYFASSEIIKLCVNNKQYASLIDFIANSFYLENNSTIKQLAPGIYGDSQFYQGQGDYYLTNTCNKWTAKAFQSMGMDITPIFHLTADSVMNFVQQQSTIQQNNTISTCLSSIHE